MFGLASPQEAVGGTSGAADRDGTSEPMRVEELHPTRSG